MKNVFDIDDTTRVSDMARPSWRAAIVLMLAGALLGASVSRAQKIGTRSVDTPDGLAASRFGARADTLLGSEVPGKGEWGLLVVDAQTGETLYEQNATKYFVPASNMKLFTTALALEKLGPDFRFHTTLESNGVIDQQGELSADLVLVGRGDPNLSNRKFPYNLKEEFDGPPEEVLGGVGGQAGGARGQECFWGCDRRR